MGVEVSILQPLRQGHSREEPLYLYLQTDLDMSFFLLERCEGSICIALKVQNTVGFFKKVI